MIEISQEAIDNLRYHSKLLEAVAQVTHTDKTLDGINKTVLVAHFEGEKFHYKSFRYKWQARLYKRMNFPKSERERRTITWEIPDPEVSYMC